MFGLKENKKTNNVQFIDYLNKIIKKVSIIQYSLSFPNNYNSYIRLIF